MKIDKEKFNKLKQLDRIEFRQRLERIEGIGFSLINLIWYILIITGVFMVGSTSTIENETALLFSQLTTFFLSLTFVLIILHILISLVFYLMRKKDLEELEEEYFSVEVKK